jgi:Sulfotransferase domain
MAVKEPNFFIEARNFGKGLDWYRSLFADPAKVCGEASPAYSKRHRHEGVPERLRDVVPQVRLIYVLRDPIDRIVSHYLHNRRLGRETRPLPVAIATKAYRNNYVQTSRYAFQLSAFLSRFPRERILIATSEELKDERAATLARIFRFIGVDPHFEDRDFARLVNRTPLAPARGQAPAGARGASPGAPSGQESGTLAWPVLERADRDRLAEHLAPDLEDLRALTGLRFERWSL